MLVQPDTSAVNIVVMVECFRFVWFLLNSSQYPVDIGWAGIPRLQKKAFQISSFPAIMGQSLFQSGTVP